MYLFGIQMFQSCQIAEYFALQVTTYKRLPLFDLNTRPKILYFRPFENSIYGLVIVDNLNVWYSDNPCMLTLQTLGFSLSY